MYKSAINDISTTIFRKKGTSVPAVSKKQLGPNHIFIVNELLRKHAYSNTCILKILPPKNENFHIKNSDIFHISAQNIDCWYSLEPPRRGNSNEYPQSMFLSRNKKNNVYPYKPQFLSMFS